MHHVIAPRKVLKTPHALTQLEESLAPTQPGAGPSDTQPVQTQDAQAPSDTASASPSELGDDLHADAESDTAGSDWDPPVLPAANDPHPRALWYKEPNRTLRDDFGYGRIPAFWFTLNLPFN